MYFSFCLFCPWVSSFQCVLTLSVYVGNVLLSRVFGVYTKYLKSLGLILGEIPACHSHLSALTQTPRNLAWPTFYLSFVFV